MGATYGLAYTCDGCGRRSETWPEVELGRTPGKNQNLPSGWRWFKCREHQHRNVEPQLHLAYVLACPSCETDALAWMNARHQWDKARRSVGHKLMQALLKPIQQLMGTWREENPEPPLCWPKASARLKDEMAQTTGSEECNCRSWPYLHRHS